MGGEGKDHFIGAPGCIFEVGMGRIVSAEGGGRTMPQGVQIHSKRKRGNKFARRPLNNREWKKKEPSKETTKARREREKRCLILGVS